GKLRHLVLSSHGETDPNKTPQVQVLIGGPGGATFNINNAERLFAQLKTVMGGGVIWICACVIAGSDEGLKLSKMIALAANCFLTRQSRNQRRSGAHPDRSEIRSY